jgi:hypothetical protein
MKMPNTNGAELCVAAVGQNAWVSAGNLGDPDNQYRWCPSGLALPPNTTYHVPPGTNPNNNLLSFGFIQTKTKFMDESKTRATLALCEEN